MADEHKTALISLIATIFAGFVLFLVTIAIARGFSSSLVLAYVVPIFMSAFTLLIFWAILFARHKGVLPILQEAESKEVKTEVPKTA